MTWDDLRPHRIIDFQRVGVALFAAGVLALGIGVATGDKADGKSSSPAPGFTPVAQVVAPTSAGPDAPPVVTPSDTNVPPDTAPAPPANNAAPPAQPPSNSGPPAPSQTGPAPPLPSQPQGPAPTATPQRVAVTPTPVRGTPVPRAPGAPVPAQPPAPAPLGAVDLGTLEQKLYVLQNAFRSAQNLGTLQLDPRLVAIARMRAQDMVSRNYFAHTSPTGDTAFGLLNQAGYVYTIAGENIARNNYPDTETANIAMDGFLNSPSHRENVMDGRFKNVGIGVAVGPDGMKYFAVVFAS
jgi:uncharacterized protein YkwD